MEGQVMGEREERQPTDVLRTKRLEIVDDEGKVRAALGTDEKGITSLSLFDASGRLRSTLDAEEISGAASGLGVFDTNGNLRAAVGMYNDPAKPSFFNLYDTDGKPRVQLGMDNDPGKGSYLALLDTEGNHRAVVSLEVGGQAGLRFSAGQKDRAIGIGAEDDGDLYLMLTEKDIPMVGLGVTEGENKDLSSELMLVDKDGRSGVVLSGGRTSAPAVRLLDRHRKRRASFELGSNGQPGLYAFEQEGGESRSANALDRVVEGGPLYHAVSLSAGLILGGLGGAWIATAASAVSGSLVAAFITGVALVAFVALLVVVRRRGW
jgi:hypothetical protein